jgi:hypothetical protein
MPRQPRLTITSPISFHRSTDTDCRSKLEFVIELVSALFCVLSRAILGLLFTDFLHHVPIPLLASPLKCLVASRSVRSPNAAFAWTLRGLQTRKLLMTTYLSNIVFRSLDRRLIYPRMLSILLKYRSFPIGYLQILMGVSSSDVPVSPQHEL